MTNLIKIDYSLGVSRRDAVASRLRQEFARLQISTSAAARAVGMSPQKLSLRMVGKVAFDVDLLDDVCAATGADFDFVVSGIRALPAPVDVRYDQSVGLLCAA